MKKFQIVVMIFCLGYWEESVKAQTTPAAAITVPAVVPPAVDASSLGKYGDVPVSMSNAKADISVPLYEIKTPRLTLPITLNYSSSGIKVDDMASWVGLEWS